MKVTLISTVKDCVGDVDAFLASLAAQLRAPDEVVIVDGGSSDGTAERFANADGISLIVEPGANIARGRNLALAAATHDVIAVTDADCVLEPTWLEELLKPIDAGADVSMGYYEPVVGTFFDACVAAVNLPLMPMKSTRRASIRRLDRSPTVAKRSRPSAATRSGCRSARTCGSTSAGVNEAWTCDSRRTQSSAGSYAAIRRRRGTNTSGTHGAMRTRACTRSDMRCGSRPTGGSPSRSVHGAGYPSCSREQVPPRTHIRRCAGLGID